jgi:putative endopeptidase
MTKKYAELASGSLYIHDYFPPESRQAAVEMVEYIVIEYKEAIRESDLIDEQIKELALKQLDNLRIYIGYDEKLLNISEVLKYYGTPSKDFSDNFFYLALQLNVQNADYTFGHKYKKKYDWTVYAKPTTMRANYNNKDNSICELLLGNVNHLRHIILILFFFQTLLQPFCNHLISTKTDQIQ